MSESFVGKPPWGYEIVPVGDVLIIRPTDEGRLWVPQIFRWIAEGMSVPEVGSELERNGVWPGSPGSSWGDSRLLAMVKRPTYSGLRVRKGLPPLPVEPLVSRDLQDSAIEALAERDNRGPARSSQPKPLLAHLKCGHPACRGHGSWPMYRVKGRYYRCTGVGRSRTGCGAPMVLIETVDALAAECSKVQGATLSRADVRAWKDRQGYTCVSVNGAVSRAGVV